MAEVVNAGAEDDAMLEMLEVRVLLGALEVDVGVANAEELRACDAEDEASARLSWFRRS